MVNCSFYSQLILFCKIYLLWPCSWDVLYINFLCLLQCPGHAGHCSDIMRGVPSVHILFSGSWEIWTFLFDRGGSWSIQHGLGYTQLKKDPRDRCSMFIYQDPENSWQYHWYMVVPFLVSRFYFVKYIFVTLQQWAVLRIRIRDPGSGAFLTPGSGIGIKSGSGMNNPDHSFRELRNNFLG